MDALAAGPVGTRGLQHRAKTKTKPTHIVWQHRHLHELVELEADEPCDHARRRGDRRHDLARHQLGVELVCGRDLVVAGAQV